MFETNGDKSRKENHRNPFPFTHDSNGRISISMEDLIEQWKKLEAGIAQFAAAAENGASIFQEVRNQTDQLTSEVSELRSEVKALKDRLSKAAAATEELRSDVTKGMVPMAAMLRELKDKEVERIAIVPVALSVIRIVDRQQQELAAIAPTIAIKEFIDECRGADREEHLNMLAGLGIEQFGVAVGAPLDPARHTVKAIRPTSQLERVGRVRAMLRPGYRRRIDAWVIRPVWVEIWVERIQIEPVSTPGRLK